MNYSLISEIDGSRYDIDKFFIGVGKTKEVKKDIIVYKYKSKYPILI